MPPLSQSDSRRRLHQLSSALRAFGLVDRYGLADIVRRPKLPNRAALVAHLKASRVVLPPSISIALVVDTILSEIGETQNAEPSIIEMVRKLRKIQPGGTQASKYHKGVFEALKRIFHPQLVDGQIEREVNSGRKRIDIVFRNDGSTGFFSDLISKHRMFCPHISFECKNYSRDIKNPEFDQLIARFDDRWGRFGVLICRNVVDKKRALLACKDAISANTKAGGGLVFLEDADLWSLASLADSRDEHGISELLHQRYQATLMA